MLVELQKRTGSLPLGLVAAAMSNCEQLHISKGGAFQTLERMMDEGSRFANLEKVLGLGAVFVLSHEGSDSL